MKNKFIIIITYILIFFNSNLFSNENNKILKIGLLAPLSGEYKELGESLLYSLQLALKEIDDKNVIIIPRDSGFNDTDKLNNAVKEINGKNIIVNLESITTSLYIIEFLTIPGAIREIISGIKISKIVTIINSKKRRIIQIIAENFCALSLSFFCLCNNCE